MALNTRTDERISLLHQVYGLAGRDRLCVVAAAGFRLDRDGGDLLTDQELWAAATESLGQGEILDPVMPKRFSEVLAAGKCCAAGGKPAQVVAVTLKAGPVSKDLVVFGERQYTLDGRLGPPEPFTESPMKWDRTFGGPGLKNPEGCTHPAKDGPPAIPPLVEYRGQIMVMKNDETAPAGLRPMGLDWPERLMSRGTFDGEWLDTCWPGLPKDFDLGYFNLASEDQQFEGRFEPGQQVEISGMHADHPRISASLPMIRVRVFAVRESEGEAQEFTELELTPDTLWLFPNKLTGVLLYRARMPVADDEASDVNFLVGGYELLSEPKRPLPYYQRLLEGEPPEVEAPAPPPPPEPVEEAAPVQAPPPPPVEIETAAFSPEDHLASLESRIAQAEAQLDMLYKQAGVNPLELEAHLADVAASALAGMKLPEVALPAGPDAMLDGLLASNKAKEAELAAAFKALGVDPNSPPALGPTPEPAPKNGAEAVEYLKDKGVKDEKLFDELRKLDKEVAAAQKEKEALIAASDPQGAAKAGMVSGGAPELEAKAPEAPEPGKGLEAPDAPGGADAEPAVRVGPKTPEEAAQWAQDGRSMAGCDLSGFDLSGLDLKEADFTDAVLEGADLSDADLTGAVLDRAKLANADLTMAKLENVRAENASFAGAKLHQAMMRSGNFGQADFTGADMSRSVCNHANFTRAELVEANLRNAEVRQARASGAVFSKADLSNAMLVQSKLEEADFDGAQLEKASFLRADLRDARLGDVRAEFTDFSDARMEKCRSDGSARFVNAFFTNAKMDGAAWDRVDATGSDFRSCQLDGASMGGCCFAGANLEKARSRNADFSKADFSNASLKQADFFQSSLRKAVLVNSNLDSASLYGVDLYKIKVGAKTNFDGANLRATLLKDRRLA